MIWKTLEMNMDCYNKNINFYYSLSHTISSIFVAIVSGGTRCQVVGV